MHAILTSPAFPSACGRQVLARHDVTVIGLPDSDALAEARFAALAEPGARFAIDSERFLAWSAHLPFHAQQAVEALADKATFRNRMNAAGLCARAESVAYPLQALRVGVGWQEVRTALDGAAAVVLKPVRGFQSDLVAICRDEAQWQAAVARALSPPPGVSPVTDGTRMIAERYIDGPEYAVDAWIDDAGSAVIVGIHLHPFRDALDARDIVYRTSPRIMRRLRPAFETALGGWSRMLGLRSIAVHVELRIAAGGQLFPIEFNPLRFGLLTMDIALHAYGLNAYDSLFDGRRPDWTAIERDADSATDTGLVVAPFAHGQGEGVEPDHAAFVRTLRERGLTVLDLHRLPHRDIPFFAAAYVSGPAEAMDSFLFEDFSRYAVATTPA